MGVAINSSLLEKDKQLGVS